MSRTSVHALRQRAQVAVAEGRLSEAVGHLQSACRLAPDSAELWTLLGNVLRANGMADAAREALERARDIDPTDLESARALAYLLRDAGRYPEAQAVWASLLAVRAPSAAELRGIVDFHREIGADRAALQLIEGFADDDLDLLYTRARILDALGDFDAARRLYRTVTQRRPEHAGAWLRRVWSRRVDDPDDPDLAELRIAAESRSPEVRACALYALAKASNDLGHYAEAFEQARRANRIWCRDHPWSPADWASFVNAQRARFPDARAVSPRASPIDDLPTPIFVVGALRSGTTLVERLLSERQEVVARGELNFIAELAGRIVEPSRAGDDTLTAVARRYLELAAGGHRDAAFVIDKNPLNFRFLGLMAQLFPNAVFLHCRRDVRDSAISSFFQVYEHADGAFAGSLQWLEAFYRGYLSLMQHWHGCLPERLLSIDYECLVSDPEEALREPLARMGEPMGPAVHSAEPDSVRTASYWQVRQPLHRRSVSRWQRYQDQAPEFFEALDSMQKATRNR